MRLQNENTKNIYAILIYIANHFYKKNCGKIAIMVSSVIAAVANVSRVMWKGASLSQAQENWN